MGTGFAGLLYRDLGFVRYCRFWSLPIDDQEGLIGIAYV